MESPADPDSRQNPLTKRTKVKTEPYSFIDSDKSTLYLPKDTQVSGSEVGKPRSKTVRRKPKAPDDKEDEDHIGSGWSDEDLKSMYHRKELHDFVDQDPVMRILKLKQIADPKDPVTVPATLAYRFDAAMELNRLLKEAGMVSGSFDADALFDLDLDVIQATSRDLFQKLKILVGEVPQIPDPLPLTTTDVIDNSTVSSHYASAAEDGSDTSSDPLRLMSLVPSGALMLEARSKIRRLSPARSSCRDNGSAPFDQATATESSDRSVGTLQKFFNAVMDRHLAEECEANKDPVTTRPQHQGSQDVEMESIRSSDHGSRWEYDPDDVDFPTSAQATVATAAAGSTGSTMIQRVRISAISDLKEFTGKDQDEDRSSASMGQQSQQDNTTILGVDPTSRHYRLNVAGLRVRLKIEDGSAKERREHQVPAEANQRCPSAPAKKVREIQIQANDSGSDSGIDSHPRIFLAANEGVTPKVEKKSTNLDPRLSDREPGHQDHNSKIQGNGFNRDRCSHCGSRNHSGLGCWRRVTCTKCDKRGHPSDHCLFVCRGCGELHDMGTCPMEEFYNQIRQWLNSTTKHMDMLPEAAQKMLKQGRSSGWNPIRAERSRYCIYAFVNKTSVDQVSKRSDLHGNTCDMHGKRTFAISSLRRVDEYAKSEVTMSVTGESRGYWRQQDPDLWFKPTDHEQDLGIPTVNDHQAKITDKIHNKKAILLLDTGAEVSIVDIVFARKVGCYIDLSQIQDCVGIGDNTYRTEGRTRIK
ncbi:hypothetical protein PHMEG_00031590, partial [Phytophthora megakarya]